MTKKITGMTNVFITFFVLIVATLIILAVFGAIDTETLKDSSLKAAAALLILTIASFVISWMSRDRQ